MQYALLVYENPSDFTNHDAAATDEYLSAWRTYYKALVDAGVHRLGGAPLQAPTTGTTIRQREGKRHVQDGPYASTKEQLGFILLELPSLDAALEWAARCPAAVYGAVEVRPLASDMQQRITGARSG